MTGKRQRFDGRVRRKLHDVRVDIARTTECLDTYEKVYKIMNQTEITSIMSYSFTAYGFPTEHNTPILRRRIRKAMNYCIHHGCIPPSLVPLETTPITFTIYDRKRLHDAITMLRDHRNLWHMLKNRLIKSVAVVFLNHKWPTDLVREVTTFL